MSLYFPSASDAADAEHEPEHVPTNPITRPCAKKTRRIGRRRHPHRLQDPDLPRLVGDHHGQVLTMLNAATSTMSSRITPMPELLELERLEERAVLLLPVDRRGTGSPSAVGEPLARPPTPPTGCVVFTSMPGHATARAARAPAPRAARRTRRRCRTRTCRSRTCRSPRTASSTARAAR